VRPIKGRAAAMRIDPNPGNRVARLVEEVEYEYLQGAALREIEAVPATDIGRQWKAKRGSSSRWPTT